MSRIAIWTEWKPYVSVTQAYLRKVFNTAKENSDPDKKAIIAAGFIIKSAVLLDIDNTEKAKELATAIRLKNAAQRYNLIALKAQQLLKLENQEAFMLHEAAMLRAAKELNINYQQTWKDIREKNGQQ